MVHAELRLAIGTYAPSHARSPLRMQILPEATQSSSETRKTAAVVHAARARGRGRPPRPRFPRDTLSIPYSIVGNRISSTDDLQQASNITQDRASITDRLGRDVWPRACDIVAHPPVYSYWCRGYCCRCSICDVPLISTHYRRLASNDIRGCVLYARVPVSLSFDSRGRVIRSIRYEREPKGVIDEHGTLA